MSLAEERRDGEQALAAKLASENNGPAVKTDAEIEQEARSHLDTMRDDWRNVDIEERYSQAKQKSWTEDRVRICSQIVQSKLAARVNSYAEQIIKVKKLLRAST